MLTQPSVQQDFVEWRQGRRHFAVWAIELDLPMLREATAAIHAASPELWLPGYTRQPHLTVHLCGFPGAYPSRADDYAPADFARQCATLCQARPEPFVLEIGRVDSFSSAAYFSVQDATGRIAKLRQILAEAAPGVDGGAFTPHVTIGLYRAARPLVEVLASLRRVELLLPLPVEVRGLSLMAYDAAVIGGRLHTLAHYELGADQLAASANDIFS